MRFPDQASAARGLLASGVAERAVRNSGEEAVSKGVKEAIQAARNDDVPTFSAMRFASWFRACSATTAYDDTIAEAKD